MYLKHWEDIVWRKMFQVVKISTTANLHVGASIDTHVAGLILRDYNRDCIFTN